MYFKMTCTYLVSVVRVPHLSSSSNFPKQNKGFSKTIVTISPDTVTITGRYYILFQAITHVQTVIQITLGVVRVIACHIMLQTVEYLLFYKHVQHTC